MPDLLVYHVLDRPPREGDRYYGHVGTIDQTKGVWPFVQSATITPSMRAVIPCPDFVDGAVDRLVARFPVLKKVLDRDLIAALLPPPPEPDVPEWAKRCADEWYSRDDLRHIKYAATFQENLARHIAKHARAAEGE